MANDNGLIAPGKTVNTPFQGGGVYVGIVRQVTGSAIYVEVPEVASGFVYGPCLVTSNAFSLNVTKQTVDGVQVVTNVTLSNVAPPVGRKVLCTFLNNEKADVVITGRIL